MPYCAIVLKDQDSDAPFVQEQGMTIGLSTPDQMKDFVFKKVEDTPGQYFIKILDMKAEKVDDTDKWVVMPEMPVVGRRVIEEYKLEIE